MIDPIDLTINRYVIVLNVVSNRSWRSNRVGPLMASASPYILLLKHYDTFGLNTCIVISLTVTYFVTSYHGDERRINEQRFNKFLTVSVLETGCGDNFRFSGTKVYITRCRNYNNNLTSVYKNLKILKNLDFGIFTWKESKLTTLRCCLFSIDEWTCRITWHFCSRVFHL